MASIASTDHLRPASPAPLFGKVLHVDEAEPDDEEHGPQAQEQALAQQSVARACRCLTLAAGHGLRVRAGVVDWRVRFVYVWLLCSCGGCGVLSRRMDGYAVW